MTHGADTSFLVAVEIVEHLHHADASRLLGELLARGDRVAITPQVLAEFVHVVTDARRFQQPFSMETALDKSERWWTATAVSSTGILPLAKERRFETAVLWFGGWKAPLLVSQASRCGTSMLRAAGGH